MANVRRNYIDRHRIGSFSGLPKFVDSKKNLGPAKEIKKQLEAIDAYTLHRPVRNHPPTRKTLVFVPFQTFGIDLVDVQRLGKLSNTKVKWILLGIDNFSRMAYSTFLYGKSAELVLAGLKRIFKQAGKFPKFLLADQVNSFTSHNTSYPVIFYYNLDFCILLTIGYRVLEQTCTQLFGRKKNKTIQCSHNQQEQHV